MFGKNEKQERKKNESVYIADTYYERQKLLNLITKNVYGIRKRYISKCFVNEWIQLLKRI